MLRMLKVLRVYGYDEIRRDGKPTRDQKPHSYSCLSCSRLPLSPFPGNAAPDDGRSRRCRQSKSQCPRTHYSRHEGSIHFHALVRPIVLDLLVPSKLVFAFLAGVRVELVGKEYDGRVYSFELGTGPKWAQSCVDAVLVTSRV